ncbi:hypothetical protein ACRS6B_08445 [Nocardia asteroides]
MRLLGEQVIAAGMDFAGTTVGGLSGINYSPRTGDFVLISDDRIEQGSRSVLHGAYGDR